MSINIKSLGIFSCIVFLASSSWAATNPKIPSARADGFKPWGWLDIGGTIQATAFASNHTPNDLNSSVKQKSANDISASYENVFFKPTWKDWAKGYVSLAYGEDSPAFYRGRPGGGNVLYFESAYFTLGGTPEHPFYFQPGIQYLDFGGYRGFDSDSLMESYSQLLALYGPMAVEVGFNNIHNFGGGAYIFNGLRQQNDNDSSKIHGFGATLWYNSPAYGKFKYTAGVSYINNMAGSYFIASTTSYSSTLAQGNYTRATPGIDLHGSLIYDQWSLKLKYVGALRAFPLQEVAFTSNYGQTFRGAQLAAWDANLAYSFKLFRQYPACISGGYQGSNQATAVGTAAGATNFKGNPAVNIYNNNPSVFNFAAIGLPQQRYYMNYTVTIFNGFSVEAELVDDKSYGSRYGGTGKSAVTAALQGMFTYG